MMPENPSDNASYTKGWGSKPNPGSMNAIERGCRCPRMDNGYGQGHYHYPNKPEEERVWITHARCPLHR